MFQNADTLWIEIIVIASVVSFLITVIGVYIYKKQHHLPLGECACCHKNAKKWLDEYHKCYSHK